MASSTTSSSSSSEQHQSGNNREPNEDMLTTPVVTTPKTSELWMLNRDLIFGVSSPNLKSSGISDLVPPETELPMDSDIGLRSPQDSILAKRRREFRRKQQSSHSDSNSCDTPTSENSPRDLTVTKPLTGESHVAQPLTPTLVIRRSPSPPLAPAASFKEPHQPHNKPADLARLPHLDLKSVAAVADLHPHYTPSPLAVPSPNWLEVERRIIVAQTPKQLDSVDFNRVFDFVPPTPRSAKLFGGASRDLDADRFARLSPRHSPRLNLPDTPTDLSCGRRLVENENIEAAEDLSMASKIAKDVSQHSAGHTNLELPVKTEYPRVKEEYRSRLSPGSPSSHQNNPPGLPSEAIIKIEQPSPLISQEPSLIHQNSPVTSMDSSGPPDYHQLRMSTSAFSIIPQSIPLTAAAAFSHRGYVPNSRPTVASVRDYRDQNNVSPASNSNIYQPPNSVGHWSQNWPQISSETMDDEASVSPPHFSNNPVKPSVISVKTDPELMNLEFRKKAKIEATPNTSSTIPPPSSRQGNNKKPSGAGRGGGGHKAVNKQPKAPGSGAGGGQNDQAGGNKRVYSCPHCQRSYDWNYNLNRHLKYECGKENAFQCAKCGRKFPHKQNCVYHLKRKHKIVCDTIDQYMAQGLVVFRGGQGAGGQQVANPE